MNKTRKKRKRNIAPPRDWRTIQPWSTDELRMLASQVFWSAHKDLFNHDPAVTQAALNWFTSSDDSDELGSFEWWCHVARVSPHAVRRSGAPPWLVKQVEKKNNKLLSLVKPRRKPHLNRVDNPVWVRRRRSVANKVILDGVEIQRQIVPDDN